MQSTYDSQWVQGMLAKLAQSKFRASFKLSVKDRVYAQNKGLDAIDRHAHDMLRSRVGAAFPLKDGKQTPYRGHPVFTAQHATGTCCRTCMERWYGIGKGRELTPDEIDHLSAVIMAWIERDMREHPVRSAQHEAEQLTLL
ncbi:DUF4186 domain-containing protein [Bifidobacterium aquikefiricola]|uniref:DUF4186 domain-containing protein n=1 Tax=Bifidobacterium aquikefiricola TaxID=3059038 RepID=A0AB39U7R0_9BIFI